MPLICLSQQSGHFYELDVSKYLLGTIIDAKVLHEDPVHAQNALIKAFKEIERIDHKYGHKQGSIVNKINRSADKFKIVLDKETFDLLSRAKSYSEKYEGLFDISVGPLVDLWGFNKEADVVVPNKKQISELLPLVDYRNIDLDSMNLSIGFSEQDMMIDLGGLAKGYAVDKAVEILNNEGIKNYIINAGGDIFCQGKNASNSEWVIGIKHPRDSEKLLAKFECTGLATSTSGDYERFIDIDSTRYHHILYPKTGMPGDRSRSVTVLTKNCEEGTVLAKYIFLLGYDKFKDKKLASEINFIIVDNAGEIYSSEQFEYFNLDILDK